MFQEIEKRKIGRPRVAEEKKFSLDLVAVKRSLIPFAALYVIFENSGEGLSGLQVKTRTESLLNGLLGGEEIGFHLPHLYPMLASFLYKGWVKQDDATCYRISIEGIRVLKRWMAEIKPLQRLYEDISHVVTATKGVR